MSSIRRQLIVKLLAGFAVLLLLGELGVFVMMRHALIAQFDDALRAKAMAIATVTRVRGDGIELNSSDRFMREFDDPDERHEAPADHGGGRSTQGAEVPPAFFQMWTAQGTTAQRSESLGSAILPFPARRSGFWNTPLPSGKPGRAITFTFVPWTPREPRAASPPPPLLLVVAAGRRELDGTLAMLAALLAVCGAGLLAITSLVVPRVLRRELAPLDALAEHAAGIDANTLANRFVTDDLPSELTPIALRFNDLLSRLQRSFERERQFSADVAHELRTPIAELRSMAELALKWPESRDARSDADALQIAMHMEGIVTGLLQLLRNSGGRDLAAERVPLRALLQGAQLAIEPRVASRRLQVTWSVAENVVAYANPELLRAVINNLLDNAVEYTPAGGAVEVDARQERGVVLRIVNDVEGLGEDDLERLFDRFWRRDPARSATGHYGLGLSIARAFAQAMGYELAASLVTSSRIALTLAGPCDPQA